MDRIGSKAVGGWWNIPAARVDAGGLAAAVDLVSLSGAGPTRVPVLGSPPLVAAAAAIPGPAALGILQGLQGKGFQLLHKRRFWIPYFMDRHETITAEQFLVDLGKGSKRLRIASGALRPADVRTEHDLKALETFYLGGAATNLPQAALADALHALYVNGWRFERKERDYGPYGAWRALTHGEKPVTLSRSSETDIPVSSPEDIARARFFRVDGVDSGLSAPVEAATLKALESKKATFWADADDAAGMTAQAAYAYAFQKPGAASIWAGTRQVLLVAFDRAELAHSAAAVARLESAQQDLEKIVKTGLGGSLRLAWMAMTRPVGNETFDERVAWLGQLVPHEYKHSDAAVKAYMFLRDALRPGDKMDDAVREYVEIRKLVGTYDGAPAQKAFKQLRDELDTVLPGPEPPAERRALFLTMVAKQGVPDAVFEAWPHLKGNGTQAERVAVFLDILGHERGIAQYALPAYDALVRLQKPGETLTAEAADYLKVRALLGGYESAQAVAAFEYIREKLDASLPGAWSHADREKMFQGLLEKCRRFESARSAWQSLTGETDKTPPHPDAEFPQKLDALIKLIEIESANSGEAEKTLAGMLAHRRPGESMADLLKDFVDLRGRVQKYDAEAGRTAFAFVRGELPKPQYGPWTADEKRAMYVRILDVTGRPQSAETNWKRIAGDQPPADLPQRLDAWLQLLTAESGQLDPAHGALAAVLEGLQPGETLEAAVKDFAGLRGKVGKWDAADGVNLFRFVRRELAGSLPGPWTDAERRAMYEKLLDEVHSHASAQSYWKQLSGVTREHPAPQPPPDFPQLVDGFLTLIKAEQGQVGNAMQALDTVRQAPSGTITDNVADYQKLRPMVGRWEIEPARALFDFVHRDLPAGQRDPFLKIQDAAKKFTAAKEAWTKIAATPQELPGRADLVAELTKAESANVALAVRQMEAIHARRKPGETLQAAAAPFKQIRSKLKAWNGGEDALKSYEFTAPMDASRERLFVELLCKAGTGELACSVWTAAEQAGGAASFEKRLDVFMQRELRQWHSLLDAMKRVGETIPAGLDRDRAGVAMIPVALLPGGIDAVMARLDHTAGDRTDSLEWLCEVMGAAGRVERFEEALRVVEDDHAAGTAAERRDTLRALVKAAEGSDEGFEASVKILRRVSSVPAAEFASTAAHALALATAMRGHAKDVSMALERVLDGHSKKLFGNVSLDRVIARFAELYATAESVESAVAKLEQEVRTGELRIEEKDGELVIGGVRVPRRESEEA